MLHLHLGDGARGLSLVREALAGSELPARVFHPTHVNRRKALFEEALALAHRGCTIDITAFPVDDGEDAWPADEALLRFLDSGAPVERVTLSSDGGGCLPHFDGDGRVVRMDIGSPSSLADTLRNLLLRGQDLARVLPAFTRNPARLLRLRGKGEVAVGSDADVVVLDEEHRVNDVMIGGRWHVRDAVAVVRGTFEEAR